MTPAAEEAAGGATRTLALTAGAVSLTKTLGEAWARDGIRVVGLAPGLVDTKLTKVTTQNPQRMEGALRAIPLGKINISKYLINNWRDENYFGVLIARNVRQITRSISAQIESDEKWFA